MDVIDLLYLSPFIAYCCIGAVVAIRHMMRSDMVDAAVHAEKTKRYYGLMVVIALALIWPVLMFAEIVSPKKGTSAETVEGQSTDEETGKVKTE